MITTFLIFSIILKLFSLLRVFPQIGSFLEVFYKILKSSAQFTAFLLLWIVAFSFWYMIMGIKLDDPTSKGVNFYKDNSRVEILLSYFILAWKNSISGPEDPTDNFWTNLDAD
jgi:hypothetical protein